MKKYSIKEVERLTGIKAHTLRIWEQRYNFIIPHRSETNIRYYDDDQVKILLNIATLIEAGNKISKLSNLCKDEIHEKIKELATSEHTLDENIENQKHINALILSMIELDEARFEKIFSTLVLQKGFECTLKRIIYPFLLQVGIMWKTDEVNMAQEHFMMQLIKQKLMVAIDGFPSAPSEMDLYLLFLPESEFNDLFILMYTYFIKAHQKRIINLGQDIPIKDVKEIYEISRPDRLMTFISELHGKAEIEEYLNQLTENFPDTSIIVAGNSDCLRKVDLPDHVIKVFTPDDLISIIS